MTLRSYDAYLSAIRALDVLPNDIEAEHNAAREQHTRSTRAAAAERQAAHDQAKKMRSASEDLLTRARAALDRVGLSDQIPRRVHAGGQPRSATDGDQCLAELTRVCKELEDHRSTARRRRQSEASQRQAAERAEREQRAAQQAAADAERKRRQAEATRRAEERRASAHRAAKLRQLAYSTAVGTALFAAGLLLLAPVASIIVVVLGAAATTRLYQRSQPQRHKSQE